MYSDPLDRLTQIDLANGGKLYFSYPNVNTVVRQQDQNTPGDGALRSQTRYDGLGREIESDTFESASQYIATTTAYDALGRVASTTNPSRPGDGLNYATSYGYDALGRVTQVATADGAKAATSYSGNQTTVTDPAGHGRATISDALGRVTSVVEDPGSGHLSLSTGYGYDALGDLTTVNQSGRARSFVYDSVGRLLQAMNPESGNVSYSYDGLSNVLTRTDNRGIQTAFNYDALSRILSKSYSDGTPAVAYSYDPAVANGKGQLGSVANGYSTTNYTGFDALGNVLASNQMTARAIRLVTPTIWRAR